MSCRAEIKRRYQIADGRTITVFVRDGIVPEDILLNGAHAEAYYTRLGRTRPNSRVKKYVKDYLIKTRITI